MPIDNQEIVHLVGQLVSVALILFIIYRRFRRNFGKQPLRPVRMTIRLVVLSILGLLLLPSAAYSTQLALVTAVALAVGIGLGVWAAKHLRFEKHDDKLYYIPHTYAGMIVTALFLGRIVYKFVMGAPAMTSGTRPATGDAWSNVLNAMQNYAHNPVTRCILLILVGYYVYYYVYVLWESWHLKPSDFEDAAANETKN